MRDGSNSLLWIQPTAESITDRREKWHRAWHNTLSRPVETKKDRSIGAVFFLFLRGAQATHPKVAVVAAVKKEM